MSGITVVCRSAEQTRSLGVALGALLGRDLVGVSAVLDPGIGTELGRALARAAALGEGGAAGPDVSEDA